MREVYFPYGMSTFGDANIMTFKVGNFKEEEVEEQLPLAKYIAKYKLTKVRLYLLARTIDDNDNELLKPVFDDGQDTVSDGLLGTSDERNSLREDQDKEYLDSLRKHREKEQAKKKELFRRQKNLQLKKVCNQCAISNLALYTCTFVVLVYAVTYDPPLQDQKPSKHVERLPA